MYVTAGLELNVQPCAQYLEEPHKKYLEELAKQIWRSYIMEELFKTNIWNTRSCAGLRAADLDWIVGPEYSLGGYIWGAGQE